VNEFAGLFCSISYLLIMILARVKLKKLKPMKYSNKFQIIIVFSSFSLIKKNQKIKTLNSFRAKAAATNLLRDPRRQGTNRFCGFGYTDYMCLAFRIAQASTAHGLLSCFAAKRI
jgi:hypothetical protein